MHRVGICTLYHNNVNYGANLQAFALRSVIESFGYETQIIDYYYSNAVRYALSRLRQAIRRRTPLNEKLKSRNKAIKQFNNEIPHSRLYFNNTIQHCLRDYDVFVVGSDQVWNPDWINPYLDLSFVSGTRPTIAYSVSIGRDSLDSEEQDKIRKALSNTDTVSVRERESVKELEKLTAKKIEHALDPTMLLDSSIWENLCSDRTYQSDYMFCYYLTANPSMRSVAARLARECGLTLITLPFLNGSYRSVDDGFGDIELFDISPQEFLSLVRYSSIVLTDSFHATVFSHLFKRRFIAFTKDCGEDSRLREITDLFQTGIRLMTPDESQIGRAIDLFKDPLEMDWSGYVTKRKESLTYLKGALDRAV